MNKTHLVLGDSHSKPGISNDRFTWLAKMISDVRADVVVDIGDFFDMESLCSYDRGKGGWERRSYADDIEAGIEAQARIMDTLKRINSKRRTSLRVTPRLVRCLGNHENRINRVLSEQTELRGVVGLDSLQSEKYGWEQNDFLKPVLVDGIAYSHYFTSGIMGRPISSISSVAASMLAKKGMNCVQGHNHVFDYSERPDAIGRKIQALSAGCFMEHEEDYAGPQVNMIWSRGISVLRRVGSDSGFDIQWVSMEEIKNRYA